MPTPSRNAWFRHYQQSRTGAFRLVHFQILGAFALALGVAAIMVRMHPYPARLQQGMEAPVPSGEDTLTTHQRTNVSVKMSAHDLGVEKARIANQTSLLPDQGQSKKGGKDGAGGTSYMDQLTIELQTVLKDPPGVVPRLNASVEIPLGPSDMDRSPLCTAFRSPRTVALVGNGPLDQAQRSEIDSCDVVVRFNLMNNWRRFKEKVDVWVIRYSTEATLSYWGITNMLAPEAANVVKLMKGMWLVGGRQKDADGLLKKIPAVAEGHPVLIPQEALAAAYSRQMNVSGGYPSTGFVGLLGALHCTPEETILHLFGFNWHNTTWKGHKMEMEKAFVEGLAREGRVVIHETICYGVRECGGSSTFDASCHWNSSGRYVCLRGKPRKWTDLTDTLGTGRLEQFRGQAPKKAPAHSGATARFH
ncbi:hypothetical protein WJX75_006764 [Coccomyxa subellipsoidea]|uniref:Uncharacterized protein n=1 Tax=Coccomyxa subellipsoidea TaxID=248742 RepID=A0ABR2Z469_9CHLO